MQPDLVEEIALDSLICFSLSSALRQAEPSDAVWERIERQLALGPPLPELAPWKRLALGMKRVSAQVGSLLFSPPEWHERLDERKIQLFTHMLFCSGSSTIGLAVV